MKKDLLDALLGEAVEIKLKDGGRLLKYVDGKWLGATAAQAQTKMRYDLIIDAYQPEKLVRFVLRPHRLRAGIFTLIGILAARSLTNCC